MLRAGGIIGLILAGTSVAAAELGIVEFGTRSWSTMFAELARAIDLGGFIALIILVITIGLTIDALYHVRIAKLIPDDLLATVQEEMANGEYEKALEVCLKSDSLAAHVFAAALAKTDFSFERMEEAMRGEAEILGLIWRQWVGQFKLLAFLGVASGVIGALLNILRLVSDLPGRPNLGLAFASSFEMRSLLYCIFGSLLIGVLSATISLLAHHFCRSKLERILLEVKRLGEELLDPFRPLPMDFDDDSQE